MVAVSEAHTAMEYYHFVDSANDFSELSSASLAHLYFVKVQNRPDEYNHMNTDDKRTWNRSKMKTIRRYSKNKLIKALTEAVRALSVGDSVN